MSYEVVAIHPFLKQAKRLLKKYPSLKSELAVLASQLEKEADLGIHLGSNIYKIRLAVRSKGKGKSGGLRIFTYVKVIDSRVYLVALFDKSKIANVPVATIRQLIEAAELD